jgi:hypothetical protein
MHLFYPRAPQAAETPFDRRMDVSIVIRQYPDSKVCISWFLHGNSSLDAGTTRSGLTTPDIDSDDGISY